MKTATLFSAYVAACNEMTTWLMVRKTNRGIAVDKDPLAVQWQRRARLAGKLDKKIRERLEGNR